MRSTNCSSSRVGSSRSIQVAPGGMLPMGGIDDASVAVGTVSTQHAALIAPTRLIGKSGNWQARLASAPAARLASAAMSEEHSHHYLGHRHERNEKRTRWVVALTAVTMVVEIAVGMMSGSMALLADGWHMATHTLALGVSALAYWLARRWAHDQRYSFGTGKVGELAGFASALALAIVAIGIAVESATRLFEPRNVDYREAIVVAVLGLVVNLVSAALLHDGHGHAHGHDHVHGDGHEYHADNNLRSAYMHVLADALTSVLAIVALAAGHARRRALARPGGRPDRRRGDPALVVDADPRHIVGLLDRVPDDALAKTIRSAVEGEGDARVTDLHLWQVGPGRFAAIVAIAAKDPADPALYKARIGCDPQDRPHHRRSRPRMKVSRRSIAYILHHLHRRRGDPGRDGPPFDLHLRDGRIMGQQLGQPQDQPDARRLVQPEPLPPRPDFLRRLCGWWRATGRSSGASSSPCWSKPRGKSSKTRR